MATLEDLREQLKVKKSLSVNCPTAKGRQFAKDKIDLIQTRIDNKLKKMKVVTRIKY